MSKELLLVVDAVANEKGVPREVIFDAIEAALASAAKKRYPDEEVLTRVVIDHKDGSYETFRRWEVVADDVVMESPDRQIRLMDAVDEAEGVDVGDYIEEQIENPDFGRIAAQAAKQVIVQRIREAERGIIYDEYIEKENEILTAIVKHVEGKNVFVELGKTEGIIDPGHMMPGEEYALGDRLKVYVLEVQRSSKGPQVLVSRTHPGLVKRLFELEVPEIQSGVVQIKSIAREAGSRTKMAVFSSDPLIDPVGSCVGPRGARVERVVAELKNEKIDIIKWSSDPAEFIANALNPARVLNVIVSDKEKSCRVIVPDNQLSLAIGKEGQNARLAAKLTGWKIDIKSQTQAEQADEEEAAAQEPEAEEI